MTALRLGGFGAALWTGTLWCAGCDATDDPAPGLDAAAATPDAATAGDADTRSPDAAPPAQCPAMLAPNQCASHADCSPDEVCYDPNEGPTGSGQCAGDELDQCDTDADCAALDPSFVCAYPDLTCGVIQGRRCQPGCADDTCADGETCGADRRCAPSVCDAATPCPRDFDCGADGHCARRNCDDHADCPTCCVNGHCFEAPGHCSYLPQ